MKDALAIYGVTELVLGSVLLVSLIYTYCKVRMLKNLSFMTRLLLMMLFIAFSETYTGIILYIYASKKDWEWSASLEVINAIVNIIYEISTILITWIVGF